MKVDYVYILLSLFEFRIKIIKLNMKYLLKLLSPFLFLSNLFLYCLFVLFNVNLRIGYIVFRKTFAATAGISNDFLSFFISMKKEKLNIENLPKQKIISPNEEEDFLKNMNNNGYYVFKEKIPENVVKKLTDKIEELLPLKLDFEKNKYVDDVEFPKEISSPKYEYKIEELLNEEIVINLISDSKLVELAKKYLKSDPICDLIACWWSFPFNNDNSSLARNKAAQMYHFDMDRIKFIKFFIYLTDVDMLNGPHCYVENSHKDLYFDFQRDGRFSDQEVIANYGNEKMKSIVGEKGSLIAVDTRGLHKGLELKEGKRLLFQIQYTNSLYGQPNHKYLLKEENNLNKEQKTLLKGLI